MLFFNTPSVRTGFYLRFLKLNLTMQEAIKLEYVPLFIWSLNNLEAEIS